MERKTVVIYDQLDAGIKFFVLNGDYRHLNNVYINQCTNFNEEFPFEDPKRRLFSGRSNWISCRTS